MRFSALFSKPLKEIPKDAESPSAIFLIKGGYIDQVGTGIYSFLPLGYKVLEKISNIIREEMNNIGGQEILMPALHPSTYWKTTGRWEVPVIFKTKSKTGQEYGLGWTHEEIVTPLAKKYIKSYKDLPVSVYQIQVKFRDEERPKSGLLRTREFLMKDLYSFHADKESLEEFYQKAIEAYKKIFNRVGIGDKTYLTYASGGDFTKYSHEFQTLSDIGEDVIYICDKCNIAINKEIIAELDNKCPECGGSNLREEKSIEVGNIFKLATKYSEPFDLKYLDKDGQSKLVEMGCYGIGPSRLMGTVAEVLNDANGIVWPEEVAPFKVYLIAIDESVKKEAEEIYNVLRSKNVEVLYDDSSDRPGEKFARADLYGAPYRLTISPKSLAAGGFELKQRQSEETTIVSKDKIIEAVK